MHRAEPRPPARVLPKIGVSHRTARSVSYYIAILQYSRIVMVPSGCRSAPTDKRTARSTIERAGRGSGSKSVGPM
jgi:hypothetical protein